MRVGVGRIRRALLALAATAAIAVTAALLLAGPAAAVVPAGFEDRLVTAVPSPVATAFAPDGRIFVTSRGGRLWVYKDGQLLPDPALSIVSKVCANSERGLVGAAVHPNFANNGFVYLYYTYKNGGSCPLDPLASGQPVNRVSRFVMAGDVIDPQSEEVLIDNIPSPGVHNSGDLHFGKDGNLYVSVGDGGCDYAEPTNCQYQNDAARDPHVLLGKILRLTPDGGIPADNPYTGASSARCNVSGRTTAGQTCRETYASGLRNPYRLAFDPNAAGTRFFINDVGGGKWEEVNLGQAGVDYGWNLREGPCKANSQTNCEPAAGMTDPIHAYAHVRPGCTAITGGAFVPDGVWPGAYDDAYLYGDYVCGKIFALTPSSDGGFTRTEFATELASPSPISMTFDPYTSRGSLYYTSFAEGGQLRRIVPTEGNRLPQADVTGTPNHSTGLEITLDASGSSDPDGNTPLTYHWDFGDGTTAETTSPTTSHTYASAGKRTVTLEVVDSLGARSDPDATVDVFPGNTPPDPVIESPAAGQLFRTGGDVVLRGSALDAEDGTLPASAFSWEVLRHHNGDHTHPWFGGVGNDLTFKGPPPEDLFATDPAGSFLEIRLTATDSHGLSRTVVREMRPQTVDVKFASAPRVGFRLVVNGTSFKAPRTFRSWPGYRLNVVAPTPQQLGGLTWDFSSWSNGRTRSHTIVTPTVSKTYTASFKRR